MGEGLSDVGAQATGQLHQLILKNNCSRIVLLYLQVLFLLESVDFFDVGFTLLVDEVSQFLIKRRQPLYLQVVFLLALFQFGGLFFECFELIFVIELVAFGFLPGQRLRIQLLLQVFNILSILSILSQ